MDFNRFDFLTRSLSIVGSRRRALALALSGTLAPLLVQEDTEGHTFLKKKCKKKSGKQKKACLKKAKKHNAQHDNNTPDPTPDPNPSPTSFCASTPTSGPCDANCQVCFVASFHSDLYPSDIAVLPDENLVTSADDQLAIFTPSGALVRLIGEFGIEPGEFDGARGVAADSAGNIFAADNDNQRIQKFKTNSDIDVWPVDGYPEGVAVGPSGVIYAGFNYQLNRLTTDGQVAYSWGPGGNAAADFDYPNGVAVDSDGTIYVADDGNVIYRFTDNNPGNVPEDWAVGTPGRDPGEFDYPAGVAVSSGRVYVADYYNRRIQALNAADGSFLFEWQTRDTDGYTFNPEGVAVGAQGQIYVTGLGGVATYELRNV